MDVAELDVLATAAIREAKNGAEFIVDVEAICGVSGEGSVGRGGGAHRGARHRRGFEQPDGVAGDLGGGSLELIEVKARDVGAGDSLPLGGLRLAGRIRRVAQGGARSGARRARSVEGDPPPGGPNVLRHRRDLAVASAAPHARQRLSAARHARIPNGSRRARRFSESADPRPARSGSRAFRSCRSSVRRCCRSARSCFRRCFEPASRTLSRSRRSAFARACSSRNCPPRSRRPTRFSRRRPS